MTELTVFHNDVDWVIAKNVEDIPKVLKEHTGYEPDEYESEDYAKLDPKDTFTMWFVDNVWADPPPTDAYPPDGNLWFNDNEDEGNICWMVTATYRQWIDHIGRGFLGSTEW